MKTVCPMTLQKVGLEITGAFGPPFWVARVAFLELGGAGRPLIADHHFVLLGPAAGPPKRTSVRRLQRIGCAHDRTPTMLGTTASYNIEDTVSITEHPICLAAPREQTPTGVPARKAISRVVHMVLA